MREPNRYSATIQQHDDGRITVSVSYSWFDGEKFQQNFAQMMAGYEFDTVEQAENALLYEYPQLQFGNFGGDHNQYRNYYHRPDQPQQ